MTSDQTPRDRTAPPPAAPPRLRLAPRPPGSGSALAVDGVCGRAVLRCAAAPMRDDLGHSRVRVRVRVTVGLGLGLGLGIGIEG